MCIRDSILIGGKDVTTMQPKDRDIAMVFQNYALYPHMTVCLLYTSVRVFSGFGLAALIGVPLGVLMGRSKIASAMLEPTINLILSLIHI